ncbi:MAG: FAD-dependent oxidoreductase, partial [Chloroflexota bacterium]
MPENNNETIIIYGATWCPDCQRAKKFFGEHMVAYDWIDITDNDEAIAYVEKVNKGNRSIPTIIYPDGTIQVEPSNQEMADQLGISVESDNTLYDVLVIGGGPAGLTSAIYTAREGLNTLVIDANTLGGQVAITQVLDNFPGFPEGVSGADFADRLIQQAKRFDVTLVEGTPIKDIRRDGQCIIVESSAGATFMARSVILATGSKYRRLNAEGEKDLIGTSVHFCATCDGAFYKDKDVLVVGGGNSGFEEGLFLAEIFAKSVRIAEYSDTPKASKILQDKVADRENMSVVTNHAVQEFVVGDDGMLDSVKVLNRETDEIVQWDNVDGVFVFIGLSPNSGFLPETIERGSRS